MCNQRHIGGLLGNLVYIIRKHGPDGPEHLDFVDLDLVD